MFSFTAIFAKVMCDCVRDFSVLKIYAMYHITCRYWFILTTCLEFFSTDLSIHYVMSMILSTKISSVVFFFGGGNARNSYWCTVFRGIPARLICMICDIQYDNIDVIKYAKVFISHFISYFFLHWLHLLQQCQHYHAGLRSLRSIFACMHYGAVMLSCDCVIALL